MRWLGPGLAMLGLATVAAVDLHPAAHRTLLEQGALAIVLSYERALPLLGLACALALARPGQIALGALLCVAGLGLGLAGRDGLIGAVVSGPATTGRLALPGPIACLAAGVALAVGDRLRPWVLPPAALVIGAMLAVAIKLVDPGFHDPSFLRGAFAAGLWLVAAIALTGRLCGRSWFGIAVRILGSWLIAIGLMLGASILVPRHTVADDLPPLPDGLERPGLPYTDGEPAKADPFAPGFDPRRPP
jgi:hypothetical protein